MQISLLLPVVPVIKKLPVTYIICRCPCIVVLLETTLVTTLCVLVRVLLVAGILLATKVTVSLLGVMSPGLRVQRTLVKGRNFPLPVMAVWAWCPG